MFHLFHWKVIEHHGIVYLENDVFGIEVIYFGDKKKGTFYLYPQIDQARGTIRYYAFAHAKEKAYFEQLTKIQGIGGKTAHCLAILPENELRQAIDTMDMKYFQKLPGIGPKTAKRIILELKQTLTKEDLWKLDIDEKLYKNITDSLHALGYQRTQVKKLLSEYPWKLEEKALPKIMKWLIDHL